MSRTLVKLTTEEERIGKLVVDSAYTVHRGLGPGLLEKVYELCFCHELAKRGLRFSRQTDVPIVYDGILFSEGLRLDVLVEDLVVCELKAVEVMQPLFLAQIMTQLKLTGKHLGFLINFEVPLIKDGIRRVVR
ncbi:MAG: GxxExxY protein [Caldilinea sp.]|nr:GxxExxY protein [Caldilinea sp.]MCB9117365.1 GxxExxY protein [Caldilineaceae bacterium]MCB0053960.1 GxxExxY protein [Caldilinea sp.]MCB9121274.1 GxxExxY protein [Caldilineaceae bacterium]MCB9125273.1 GxxExxY protein [Caldilineaceae bacterium]